MVETALLTIKDYRSGVQPTWCPGCGDFAVLSATYKAMVELQLRPENVVVVSGIGCSSRIPYFVRTYGVHSLHGRAVPLASGVKLANPKLTVFAMGGDGDFFSIGAGHLPHAARRNIGIVAVCMDNQIYGLTKGQLSPTSNSGHVTKSTPFGGIEKPINPVLTALASGATFVARAYSGDPKLLQALIVEAVKHPGFAFIHVKSPCTEFNNTFNILDKLVQDIPEDHDPSNLHAAIRLVLEEGEKLNLGVFYKTEQLPYEQAVRDLDKAPKAFDAVEFLRQYS